MATATTGGVEGMTPEQVQQALGQHVTEQLSKIEEADAAARAVSEQNAQKVKAAIDAALAKALMGTGQGGNKPVAFPAAVFELAVALTQQPALIPPILAFYQRLRSRINEAVDSVLKDFTDKDSAGAGSNVDTGTPSG